MSGFHEFAVELFAELGAVSARKMFGGAGLYFNGVMFALIESETIYLKTDEPLAAALKAEGATAWVYAKNPQANMSYYRLPEGALDDPEEAARWGRKAYEVAAAAKTAKPKAKPKTRRVK